MAIVRPGNQSSSASQREERDQLAVPVGDDRHAVARKYHFDRAGLRPGPRHAASWSSSSSWGTALPGPGGMNADVGARRARHPGRRSPPGRGAPHAGRDQFDRIPGRVPDVQRVPTSGPGVLLLDLDPAGGQVPSPVGHPVERRGRSAPARSPRAAGAPRPGGPSSPDRTRATRPPPRPGRRRVGPAPGRSGSPCSSKVGEEEAGEVVVRRGVDRGQ